MIQSARIATFTLSAMALVCFGSMADAQAQQTQRLTRLEAKQLISDILMVGLTPRCVTNTDCGAGASCVGTGICAVDSWLTQKIYLPLTAQEIKQLTYDMAATISQPQCSANVRCPARQTCFETGLCVNTFERARTYRLTTYGKVVTDVLAASEDPFPPECPPCPDGFFCAGLGVCVFGTPNDKKRGLLGVVVEP